ncbi:MAG: hypothetical protein BWY32_02858 [bacterium ADurb.Bin243]|nr:MAG: hypothetical protein BWY32_02858 [bacterium ADurb.Bin243]
MGTIALTVNLSVEDIAKSITKLKNGIKSTCCFFWRNATKNYRRGSMK